MKSKIIAGIFSLLVPFGLAHSQQQAECGPTAEVLALLQSEYKEVPLWIGEMGSTAILVAGNQETETWSVIQMNREKACVIAYGKNFENLFPKTNQNFF